MVKKLISRSEFAAKAGVSGAAISKACKGPLLDACEGKFIDLGHKSAIAYIESKQKGQTAPALEGIDSLYEEALEICKKAGKCSQSLLRDKLMIGSDRARKLVALIQNANIKDLEITAAAPAKREEPKRAHVRGTAAKKQKQIQDDDEELLELLDRNVAQYADMTLREIIKKFGTATRFAEYLRAMKEISIIEDREIKLAQMKGELVHRDLVSQLIIEPIDSAHVKLMRDGSKTIAVRMAAMHGSGADINEMQLVTSELIASFIKPVKSKVNKIVTELKRGGEA